MPAADKSLAQLDEATKLPNRRGVYSWLREQPKPGVVLYLDVDKMGELSDAHTRRVADLALGSAAERLKRLVAEGDLVARYGNDEFALLLPGRPRSEAESLADGICSGFAANTLKIPDAPKPVSLTFSIGLAESPAGKPIALDDLARARRACRAAKAAGRATVVADDSPAVKDPSTDPWAGFPSPVLAQRDELLARLAIVPAKLPQVVLLHGPAGVGKTRLLRTAGARYAATKTGVAIAVADEANRFASFRSLGDLLELLGTGSPQAAKVAKKRLEKDQLAVLRLVAPGFLGEATPGLDMPTPEKAASAVVALLNALRDLHPTFVLAIDEAAAADHASLDTLKALLGFQLPLLVLLTSEDATGKAEGSSDNRLPALLETLRGRRKLEEIPVPSLDAAGVGAVAAAMLPGDPMPAEVLAALQAASGGVPLYVEEGIRDLVLSGRAKPGGGKWTWPAAGPALFAPTLRQGVIKTLAALSINHRDLVNQASVLGRKFDLDLLQATLSWNDLEFFDRLDHLLALRLLRPLDPAVPEVIEFASDYTRAVAYGSLNPLAQRRIHLRVGTVLAVQENDFGGGADVQYHLERCGASDEAEAIRRRMGRRKGPDKAAPVRVTRIGEGDSPLPPQVQNAFEAAVKALAGAVKSARLYPQHNKVQDDFLRTVETSMKIVLDTVPAATLRYEDGSLKINTVPVDARKQASLSDLAKFLDERLLVSMTFTRGLEAEEGKAVLEGLIPVVEASKMTRDHWDRFLFEKRFRHVDLVQRAYVARAGETIQRLKKSEVVERPLRPEEIQELSLFIRNLKTGVDAVKLYPPGHVQVEDSFRAALAGAEKLLASVEPVTFAPAEGKILVNGQVLDAKDFGASGTWMADEIQGRGLMSLTLSRGMDDPELRVLGAYLALTREEGRAKAKDILGASDLRHLTFGALVFDRRQSVVGAAAAIVEPEPDVLVIKVENEEGVPIRLSRGPRADIRARLLLGQDPANLIQGSQGKTFPSLLEALNYGSTCDLAGQLVRHLAEGASKAEAGHKLDAWKLIRDTLEDATRETARLLVSAIAHPLRDVLNKEQDGELLRTAGDLVPLFVEKALEARAGAALWDVLRDALQKRLEDGGVQVPTREYLRNLALRIAGAPAMKLLLKRLSDSNRDERQQAVQLVGVLGEAGSKALLDYLFEEKTPSGRLSAAEALGKIGGNGPAEVLQRISTAPPAQAAGLLDVAEHLGAATLPGFFAFALEHPEESVRTAGILMLKRARVEAVAALKEPLGNPKHRNFCLKLASELKLAALAPEIGKAMDDSEDAEFLAMACKFAAATQEPRMIAPLDRILKRKSTMFKKGLPDQVRADAAWALGQIPHTEAQFLAREAEKDASPIVRGAARSGRTTIMRGKPSP